MKKIIEKNHPWASQSIRDVIAHFQTNITMGLTSDQAQHRLRTYGLNRTSARDNGISTIIVHQLKSPFIYVLAGVALVSFISQGTMEGCIILLIILINMLLGFYQEYSAHTELKKLHQHYMRSTALVVRDGKKQEIDAAHLVPGDVVIVAPGDVIDADMRITQSEGLMLDEALLTGESYAQPKVADETNTHTHQAVIAATIALSGTSVISGYGQGIVIATGDTTMFGDIAHLALETQKSSAFMQELATISAIIVRLVLICLLFVFVVQLINKGSALNLVQLAIFSCALAVSIIPNALPLVMSFALAHGARKLAQNKVIVKRLESIEDLGNMDILCVDKTGTLTENTLSFLDAYSTDTTQSVVMYGALPTLLSSGQKMFGGFDQACAAALASHERTVAGYQLVDVKPFDPQKQYARYIIDHQGTQELIIQGAPEDIFNYCHTNKDNAELSSWLEHHANLGSRIIALAYKKLVNNHTSDDDTAHTFTLIGCIAFHDPIKPTAAHAIIKARALGVTIKVLSGDRKEVCGTVAHAIGLIENPHDIITGDEYARMHEAEKRAALKRYTVFARMYPQQKYEIVSYLQQEGIVGYLGDGINDAPALRKAHIAITVQGAADIARGEADIVLLKKSLMVIIDGIAEGRKVFANSVKYIRITLASNFGNFFSIVAASLMLDFLPMLPVQILLGDLLSDLPMMAIATDHIDAHDIKRPRHYDITSLLSFIIIMGCVSTFIDILFFLYFKTSRPEILQTSWFIMSCLTEVLAIFSLRTYASMFKVSPPSILIIGLSLSILVLATALPFLSIGHTLFNFVSLSSTHLAILYGMGCLYVFANEVVKYALRYKKAALLDR
jgi:Mg2+-importing ATPase